MQFCCQANSFVLVRFSPASFLLDLCFPWLVESLDASQREVLVLGSLIVILVLSTVYGCNLYWMMDIETKKRDFCSHVLYPWKYRFCISREGKHCDRESISHCHLSVSRRNRFLAALRTDQLSDLSPTYRRFHGAFTPRVEMLRETANRMEGATAKPPRLRFCTTVLGESSLGRLDRLHILASLDVFKLLHDSRRPADFDQFGAGVLA